MFRQYIHLPSLLLSQQYIIPMIIEHCSINRAIDAWILFPGQYRHCTLLTPDLSEKKIGVKYFHQKWNQKIFHLMYNYSLKHMIYTEKILKGMLPYPINQKKFNLSSHEPTIKSFQNVRFQHSSTPVTRGAWAQYRGMLTILHLLLSVRLVCPNPK